MAKSTCCSQWQRRSPPVTFKNLRHPLKNNASYTKVHKVNPLLEAQATYHTCCLQPPLPPRPEWHCAARLLQAPVKNTSKKTGQQAQQQHHQWGNTQQRRWLLAAAAKPFCIACAAILNPHSLDSEQQLSFTHQSLMIAIQHEAIQTANMHVQSAAQQQHPNIAGLA